MVIKGWKKLPQGLRQTVGLLLKATLTFGAFYLLLNHAIEDESGKSVVIWDAIVEHMATIEMATFLPWVLLAAGIKVIGIFSSMVRWHLLLKGQGIRFNFGHIVGSFLIGRFLGTFLPSTVGLDGYKLYDAAKFSDRVIEPAAATAIEKVIGSAAPKDGRISIILPEIAENGGVVPLKINVDSPMNQQDFVKSVHIFADGNPLPEVANYHLSPHNGKAEFSLRIRLAKTQKIIAVAEMNDGQVFIARREIKVTLGGCGG